ncbi:MAG: hypothetical protein RID91_18065 [Azospirillaceae bacterium]
MPRTTPAESGPLGFSDAIVHAWLAAGPTRERIDGAAVVVNAGAEAATIDGPVPQTLAPFDATLVRDAAVEGAGSLIVLAVREADSVGALASAPGWRPLAEIVDAPDDAIRQTALWRSPKAPVATVSLDDGEPALAGFPQDGSRRFAATANLWFAPAGTDCLIHDRHGFVEFHAQLHGVGVMQKFRERDPATLFEERWLVPGVAHRAFDCVPEAPGVYRYPWHQYRAETDCVWLAVEYHPEDARPRAGRE